MIISTTVIDQVDMIGSMRESNPLNHTTPPFGLKPWGYFLCYCCNIIAGIYLCENNIAKAKIIKRLNLFLFLYLLHLKICGGKI